MQFLDAQGRDEPATLPCRTPTAPSLKVQYENTKESSDLSLLFLETMNEGAFTASTRGVILYCNKTFAELVGLSVDQLVGMDLRRFVSPGDVSYWEALLQELPRAGARIELHLTHSNHTEIRVQLSARSVPDSSGMCVIVTDLSRQPLYTQLRQSEDRYRTLHDSIHDGFCIIEIVLDAQGNPVDYVFRESNDSFDQQTGIFNARGKSLRSIESRHEAHWFEFYSNVAAKGVAVRFEYLGGESRRWYEGRAYRIGGPDEKRVGVIFNDMTDQRRSEEKLQDNERRLRLALEAGQMGAWDLDLTTNLVTCDAKQHEMLGLPFQEKPTHRDAFWGLVHSDDVQPLKDALNKALAFGSFALEFRIVRPDGTLRWISGVGATLKNDDGLPLRVVGLNHDVTERLQTEECLRSFTGQLEELVTARTEELLESQRRLRALATELSLTEQRERQRLATELHDHLAQMLVVARLKLSQAKRAPGLVGNCALIIDQTDEVLVESLKYTRTLVADLYPPELRDFGLPAALKWLSEYMERYELIVVADVPEDDPLPLPEDRAVLLFQSVRELLINSSKHSGTHTAFLSLRRVDDRLLIHVVDEGQGFDLSPEPSPQKSTAAMSSKFGLFSIRERMRALGGIFEIDSAPGIGTTATLMLPLPSALEVEATAP